MSANGNLSKEKFELTKGAVTNDNYVFDANMLFPSSDKI
jgi:hypothetical protein